MELLDFLFLGSPCFEKDKKLVKIKRRKAVALAAYLVVTGKKCSRDKLATLFWPEYDQKNARASLRRTLSIMTQELGKSWLEIDRESIMFVPCENLSIDVNNFLKLNEKIKSEEKKNTDCLTILEEAIAIYRDDFMSGFSLKDAPDFDDWLFEQSEWLRSQAISLTNLLIDYYFRRNDFSKAVLQAQRLINFDPFNENGHRKLIRAFALNNQQNFALRQYDKLKKNLRKELDTHPEEKTAFLAEEIRKGRFAVLNHSSDNENIFKTTLTNLPAQSTTFVGRERDVENIIDKLTLPEVKLLTISGPGGIGKTRIAIQSASLLLNEFSDGVFYISLADLPSHKSIAPGLIKILGLSFTEKTDPRNQVIDFLNNKNILLVFDNYEYLMEGLDFISDLLKTTDSLKILVTSRERLMIQGEFLINLSGLSYPKLPVEISAEIVSQSISVYDGISLFIQTAEMTQADFKLNTENYESVIQICELVEGNPLGLILSASWIEIYPPIKIVSEINKNLDFLKSDLHDIPYRHQSMRAVFDSTFDLLNDQEKSVFMRLAVFQSTFAPEAVAVVTDMDSEKTIMVLATLARKSLLKVDAKKGRFEIHPLLQQYLKIKIDSTGITDKLMDKHMGFYLKLLIKNEKLLLSDFLIECRKELDEDFINIRHAWLWAVEKRNLRILIEAASALYVYFDMHTHYHEGEVLFNAVKNIIPITSDIKPDPAFCIILLCWFDSKNQSSYITDTSEIEEKAKLCFDAAYESNNKTFKAVADLLAGAIALYLGQNHKAITLFRQSLTNDPQVESAFFVNIRIGFCHRNMGMIDRAMARFQQSFLFGKENGDSVKVAWSLTNIGMSNFSLGNLNEAELCLRDAVDSFSRIKVPTGLIWSYAELSIVAFFNGDIELCKLFSDKAINISNDICLISSKYFRALTIRGFVAIVENDMISAEKHLNDLPGNYDSTLTAFLCQTFYDCLKNDFKNARKNLTKVLSCDLSEHTPHLHVLLLVASSAILLNMNKKSDAALILHFAFYHPYWPKKLFKIWKYPDRLRTALKSDFDKVNNNKHEKRIIDSGDIDAERALLCRIFNVNTRPTKLKCVQ